MPNRSKFTAETRTKILQALQVGASRRTAAHVAGVDESQLRRWFKRGEESEEGTRYREFYEAVLAAEAAPRLRALGLIYKELPDNPGLAWKFIERREPGYEPPMPMAQPPAAPVVIELSFSQGALPNLPAIDDGMTIEGEVVDEQDLEPGAAAPASP